MPRGVRLHGQHLRRDLLHGDRLPRLPRHHRHDLPDRLPDPRHRGDFTPKQHFGFEAAAWYWHFVDVVWLFLFAASTSGERASAPPCTADRRTLPESATGEREPCAGPRESQARQTAKPPRSGALHLSRRRPPGRPRRLAARAQGVEGGPHRGDRRARRRAPVAFPPEHARAGFRLKTRNIATSVSPGIS